MFISWSCLWWLPMFSVKWRWVLQSAVCRAAVRFVSEKWRRPVRSTQRLLLPYRNLHYINGLSETCKQSHLTAIWFWGTFSHFLTSQPFDLPFCSVSLSLTDEDWDGDRETGRQRKREDAILFLPFLLPSKLLLCYWTCRLLPCHNHCKWDYSEHESDADFSSFSYMLRNDNCITRSSNSYIFNILRILPCFKDTVTALLTLFPLPLFSILSEYQCFSLVLLKTAILISVNWYFLLVWFAFLGAFVSSHTSWWSVFLTGKKMTIWVLPSVFNIIISFSLLTCMEFLFILVFKILSLDADLQTYSTVRQAFLSYCWLVDLLFWSFMCPHSFIFAFIVCSSGVIVKTNVKDHFSRCFLLGVSQYLVFISESSIHFMFICMTESEGAEIKVQIQLPMCKNQFSLCIYWNSPYVSTVFLDHI